MKNIWKSFLEKCKNAGGVQGQHQLQDRLGPETSQASRKEKEQCSWKWRGGRSSCICLSSSCICLSIDVFVFLFFVFVFYVKDLHLQRETTLRTVAGAPSFKSWPKEDSGGKGENDCKREEREQERTDWWESLRGGTHHQSSHHGTTETGSGECFSETGHRSGFKLLIIDHFLFLQAIEESPRPINKKAVLRDLETILAQEIHLGYLVKVGARQKELGN